MNKDKQILFFLWDHIRTFSGGLLYSLVVLSVIMVTESFQLLTTLFSWRFRRGGMDPSICAVYMVSHYIWVFQGLWTNSNLHLWNVIYLLKITCVFFRLRPPVGLGAFSCSLWCSLTLRCCAHLWQLSLNKTSSLSYVLSVPPHPLLVCLKSAVIYCHTTSQTGHHTARGEAGGSGAVSKRCKNKSWKWRRWGKKVLCTGSNTQWCACLCLGVH